MAILLLNYLVINGQFSFSNRTNAPTYIQERICIVYESSTQKEQKTDRCTHVLNQSDLANFRLNQLVL